MNIIETIKSKNQKINHKKSLVIILFTVWLIGNSYSQTMFNNFIIQEQNEKSLDLYYKSTEKEIHLYKFSYLPFFTKRLCEFDNGSIVGYLPDYNPELRIKAWNDLRSSFILFYCDARSGDFLVLDNDFGWKFRILDSNDSSFKWICKISNKSLWLSKINEDGKTIREIEFDTLFETDSISIIELDEYRSRIRIGIIEREAIYEVDWNTNQAILIEEIHYNYKIKV